jgi:hypothetical protein
MNQVKDTVAQLKGIPTEQELNNSLREGVLVVTFNKLNGDERVMTCTKKLDLIPEANRPKTEKVPPVGNITAWDINANGWRSFKYDRVTKIENN